MLSSRDTPEMKVYGSEGSVEGMFCRPQGVKVDPEGHILICDSRNNRIQVEWFSITILHIVVDSIILTTSSVESSFRQPIFKQGVFVITASQISAFILRLFATWRRFGLHIGNIK